jgi:hypothetical protein
MLLCPRGKRSFQMGELQTHEMCCCVMRDLGVVRSSNQCLQGNRGVHLTGGPCHLDLYVSQTYALGLHPRSV